MNTKTTKGNHEFSSNDLSSAVCGGRGEREHNLRENGSQRKRVSSAGGRGNGDTVGIAQRRQIDSLRHASFGGSARARQFVASEMDSRSLQFVINACGGVRISGPTEAAIQRVCTDSRQVLAGDVFFALRGERFDGHAFVGDAAGRGAVAAVVENGHVPQSVPGCAVIAVDDARKALGYLAARYRMDFDLPIIAVGGSNGKTSTKDLIAAVLKQKLSTLASEASFNNDIGVPLTLLRLEKAHRAAVVEVGTNHPGELAPLVRMIRPEYGVITVIGREHLEFFGDLAGVVQEEGWVAELLPASGKLFINGDDEWAASIAERSHAMVIRVGMGKQN